MSTILSLLPCPVVMPLFCLQERDDVYPCRFSSEDIEAYVSSFQAELRYIFFFEEKLRYICSSTPDCCRGAIPKVMYLFMDFLSLFLSTVVAYQFNHHVLYLHRIIPGPAQPAENIDDLLSMNAFYVT